MVTPHLGTALLVAAVMAAAAGTAQADWGRGRGEQMFGPDIPEADACRAAEDRAREAALKSVLGERLTAEDLMVCSEAGADADCGLHRTVWSTVDGEIRAVRNRHSDTTDGPVAGFRRCVVTLEADVGVAVGQPDPGFDLGVTLNERIFRDGDPLTLTLSPSQPMHVAMFQWLPYAAGDKQVTRIFPNPMDKDDRIIAATTVPTPDGSERYRMKVVFPDGEPASKRLVDEYLLVVATRQPVEFREAYALDDLKARLLEIPRPDSRLVERAYAVVRGK